MRAKTARTLRRFWMSEKYPNVKRIYRRAKRALQSLPHRERGQYLAMLREFDVKPNRQ